MVFVAVDNVSCVKLFVYLKLKHLKLVSMSCRQGEPGPKATQPPPRTRHKHMFKLHLRVLCLIKTIGLITSAKEVVFAILCLFVCLCVSKITQKVMYGSF